MANTYTALHYHVIFSTKKHHGWLQAGIQGRMWSYLGGIARENKIKPLAIGGTANHVHLLLGVPAVMPLSKAVQALKGGASHWVKSEFPELRDFAWQDGYGAFTVSKSQVQVIEQYIRNQAEHHRQKSFQEEYRDFLKKHGIEFDERYLLG